MKILSGIKPLLKDPEIVVPLAAAAASWPLMYTFGSPCNIDKVSHFLFGYGLSRLGRKIAENSDKEVYSTIASVASNLAGVFGYECLWEANPYVNKVVGGLLGKTTPLVVDGNDIYAGVLGLIAENSKATFSKIKKHFKKK